jgi:hypothetical protein
MKVYKSTSYLNDEIKKDLKKQKKKVGKITRRLLRMQLKILIYRKLHPRIKIHIGNNNNKKVIFNPNYLHLNKNQRRNIRRKLANKTVSIYRIKDKRMEVVA